MNKLVEITEQNNVLNALWYADKWGLDIEKTKASTLFGPTADILGYIGELLLGKYRLVLTSTGQEYSLGSCFESDEELANFIAANAEGAFKRAVKKHSDYIYVLNILTVKEYHYYRTNYVCQKDMGKDLPIFMPIIQKFMIDALTDRLGIGREEG